MGKGKGERTAKSVDWVEVRSRIDAAGEALSRGWSLSATEKREVLKARAKALAQSEAGGEPRDQMEIVEFLLSGEKYGIESRHVREVCPIRDFTPLPCTPPFVLGIILLRGEIHSVVDLRKFLELPEQGLGDLNRVILLASGDMQFGVLADSILGVGKVPLQDLHPAPPTFTGLSREYIQGIGPEGIAILDADRILSDQRIIVNEFV